MTQLSPFSIATNTLTVPPSAENFGPDSVYISDLPTNRNGRLTREKLLQRIGGKVLQWDSEKRPFFTLYSGSRIGNREEYIKAAKELGAAIEDKGWVIVNGGATPGLMGAALEQSTRMVCIIPELFASNSGAGVSNENMYDLAINSIVPDFWERKAGMTLLANGGFFVLPGGFGSVDEALETIVFAKKNKTHVTFVNSNGYWDRLLAQLDFFVAQGLMPSDYKDYYSSVANGREAVQLAAEKIPPAGIQISSNEQPKPQISLRAFLEANPSFLPDTVFSFLGKAPRVGVIASGNIGNNDEIMFNLANKSLRTMLLNNTKRISKNFAEAGAALVIMGDRRGLRAEVADAVLKAKGKILWLEKGHTQDPLQISKISKQEMVAVTPRYFERARLFATLSQGEFLIAGGIHSANEALSHATRNQTGHGDYCDLVPHCRQRDRDRMIVHVYDPYLDKHGTRLWALLQDQFRHCSKEGFLKPADLGLLRFYQRSAPIVKHVLKDIKTQPDFLREMKFLARTRKEQRAELS